MTGRRVALVTGAGKRRVGNVVARRLAERDFAVAVHYRTSAEDAAESVAEIKAAGGEAIAVHADVAIEADVDQMVAAVVNRFGRIDVLVNSAAVWRPKRLEDITAADVRQQWEANSLGTFLCARCVGLMMCPQPTGGSIINIGDWSVARPYRDYAAYYVSKGAIATLTRSLAVEFAARNPQVRVNCVMPGPVMLPPELSPAERESIVRSTLVKREGMPDHVAQAVLFFVENDFVTGVCLPVDGGRTIYPGEDVCRQ